MRRQNAKRKVEEETQNKKKEIKVIHEHVVISTLSEIDPLPRIEKVKKAIDRERLVKLLEDTFHYSLAFSEKLVEEYIYFIALFLVAHEEEFLECITPPPKIDFAWKEHISDTKVYLEFCKKLKVEFLDRTVDLTVRDKDHAEQIKKTKRIMESWTGGSVSMDVWNLEDMRKLKGVDIHILHSGGSTIIPFNAFSNEITVMDVKEKIFELFEIDVNDQRLTYCSQLLTGYTPLSSYGIKAWAFIDLEQNVKE